MTWIDVKR